MPGREDSTDGAQRRQRRRWTREESTALVAEYEALKAEGMGQREFADLRDVPLGTLQFWLARKAGLDADPVLVGLLESPTGLAFLHRLVLAAMFQFCHVGPCGVDHVGAFLRLAKLDVFVAASHAVMHELGGDMEQAIVDFGAFQRAALAAGMKPRSIVVAQDETFHPEVCLVAMEPASNFILLERYAPNREADTWTAAMSEALADLPVEVVAAASDEGRWLIAHITRGLGVAQAPDVMHAQRDLHKALGQPLAHSLKAPLKALEAAEAALATWCRHKLNYWSNPRGPGRPPLFDKAIATASTQVQAARGALAVAVARCDRAEAAIRALSRAYHPVDLVTGAPRTAATVDADLTAAMANLDAAAEAIELPAERRTLIDKARRVVAKQVAHVAFFHAHVDRQLAAFTTDETLGEIIRTRLIPAWYLLKVARQAPTAAERNCLRATGQRFLGHARSALANASDELQRDAERLARECVDIFVRGTSCVEGRNGQLALRHHSLHRLSDRRLAALTVIHDYHLRRADGTTAAQRFFGADHDELFEWLLDHLEVPARPRSRAPARAA
jgi:hypothetical protein